MKCIAGIAAAAILGCLALGTVGAEPLPYAEEFADIVGWTIGETAIRRGAPESIFAHRGNIPEEDSVVFYYPDYLYLFLFRDRVWQVRADERWKGEVDGVRMGISRAEVEELWGAPINRDEGDPTWTLPDRGYPMRVRLFFREDSLIDLYVYRSDW